ncbi:MAG: hypothetical protein RLZZ453_1215 [Chlamydiota bacterium]|jgi:CBS domain containing-hemolysin-like protein
MFYLSLLMLVGSSTLTALSAAIQRKGKWGTEEFLKQRSVYKVLLFFFRKNLWMGLLLSLSFSKHLLRILYVIVAFVFLTSLPTFQPEHPNHFLSLDPPAFASIAALILLASLITESLFIILSEQNPKWVLNLFFPLGSFFLYCCLPLATPFFYLIRHFPYKRKEIKEQLPDSKLRDKVYELLKESELASYLDLTEQQFILSMVSFKGRIAREVMVPRINVFSLGHDISIETAAEHFSKEGYSRIPVYKESVDDIVGVLLHKDILKCYLNPSFDLKQSVQKLIKPVIYTPETKKISQLLQDFRNKQIHMAIIVDEWGGTEGIVTIEDILEELVGEIADEHDIAQQTLFAPLEKGSWAVDAKMSIIDIQEDLGITIPQSPEYDTIGGYVFHRAGSIPLKGWKLHHDDFELEVLGSNERAIEKIKLSAIY